MHLCLSNIRISSDLNATLLEIHLFNNDLQNGRIKSASFLKRYTRVFKVRSWYSVVEFTHIFLKMFRYFKLNFLFMIYFRFLKKKNHAKVKKNTIHNKLDRRNILNLHSILKCLSLLN